MYKDFDEEERKEEMKKGRKEILDSSPGSAGKQLNDFETNLFLSESHFLYIENEVNDTEFARSL